MSYQIIRYEEVGNELHAVCENEKGNRWYMVVLVDGEPVF